MRTTVSHWTVIFVVAAFISGCASTHNQAALNEPDTVLSVGRSTRSDVLSTVGEPTEKIRDKGEEIWVYGEERTKVPTLISFIPVVGDILDVAETVRDMKARHELIVIFDDAGVVKSFRRREAQ
ncbi:hypothetical protein [Denitromonas iodatirespirans]|uniref:Outer membrane protein assembly factor BamE n=1 Tax=Denitromonas iodatirespirans TaxID=2795389 RepID=A0A944HFZ6_DENI1|nr:hypothetical protein [Denitromonas iodatirespirans]MBT0964151.1 hypothetical protein [Denitromonas iodatirespirans]